MVANATNQGQKRRCMPMPATARRSDGFALCVACTRYGPFWIATTLVFVTAVTGNYASYVSYNHKHAAATGSETQAWYYDIDKVLPLYLFHSLPSTDCHLKDFKLCTSFCPWKLQALHMVFHAAHSMCAATVGSFLRHFSNFHETFCQHLHAAGLACSTVLV